MKYRLKTDIIYRIRIIILLIFIFSLPFENWDPFGVASFFSITKMTGVLYAILMLYSFKTSFDFKHTFPLVKILLTLWLWTVIQSLIHYAGGVVLSIFHLTFFQGIILFWLISSDVIRNPKLLPQLFLALISGVTLMCLLANMGIGISIDYIYGLAGNARLSFFGSNPNIVGLFCSVSFIFAIYLIINRKIYYKYMAYLLVPCFPLMITMVGLTGSRGALGIIIIGLIVLFTTIKTTPLQKLLYIVVGTSVVFFAVNTILESEIMQKRVNATLESDDLAGRDKIWSNTLEIIYDNPLTGFGSSGFEKEMLGRFGYSNDTHNVYLYFMVTGGIVALFIYLYFLGKVSLSAWSAYSSKNNSLVLVLLFIYLFSAIKSGGFINNKFMWVLIAIIFASNFAKVFTIRKNLES